MLKRTKMDENLARQAELAIEQQGDYDSLFYEGRWHSSGQLAGRAHRAGRTARPGVSGRLDLDRAARLRPEDPVGCRRLGRARHVHGGGR